VEPSRGTRTNVHTNACLREICSAVVPRFRVKTNFVYVPDRGPMLFVIYS